MKLLFIGPQGCGKGTQAAIIAKRLGILHISTGDLLRAAVKEQSELGNKAKSFMDSGELVPDELVIDLLKERIKKSDCGNGFILDGFPRTIPQAEALRDSGIEIDKVVNFTVSNDMIIERLSGRRTCKKCGEIYHIKNIPPKQEGVCDIDGSELFQRDDDKVEAIQNRLVVYDKQTAPLIEFYKETIVNINAENNLDEVVSETIKSLDSN